MCNVYVERATRRATPTCDVRRDGAGRGSKPTSVRLFESGKFRRQFSRSVVKVEGGEGGSIAREVLSRQERTKLNTGNDAQFYGAPRLVTHVDNGFLSKLTQLYRERIQPGASVLDLCSSWISHLPPEVSYSKVTGHGMNATELAQNGRLDDYFIRNLNTNPTGWAAKDQTYDAVICCVSIQYLQQPEEVLAEVYRVLKPGGVCIISFSNRLYYEKAISVSASLVTIGLPLHTSRETVVS
ncbi:hypothetical protein CYMTET_24359 [Cymbomonas tetramitiformis]|uniref:Methyltransferase type 11 domain-containing protein n=1 Tax=Cymbomonas tetramitiformis TaxID=36881 RepID=A0AAE0L052_9CHLO|nr:hypothetical protein CYMTET_24359 [Cymbomonas tetramitiformis]